MAEDALNQPDIPEAADHQADATNAFEKAEKQFDEILQMIADKQDQAPPPSSPGGSPPSLEDMLTMLKNEQKLAEQLGLSGRPLNVSIMRDWMNPSSSSGGGQSQASGRAAQQQANAAQRQANNAQRQGRGQRNRGNNFGRGRARGAGRGPAQFDPNADGEGEPGEPVGAGPRAPVESWNTLVSKLGDEIRQGRDNVPPEQYRQAIEHYFEQISETLPIVATPEKSSPPGN